MNMQIRKNILLTSFLRQKLRFSLLMVLLALAMFMLAMRYAEHIFVTKQIERIGAFYRSIGFVQNLNESGIFSNVLTAADIIEDSQYVAFGDRQRSVGGHLVEMQNADIEGIFDLSFEQYAGHNVAQVTFTDAFFYAKLISIERGQSVENPAMVLRLQVDSVVLGYPEHVEDGQSLTMIYYLSEDEIISELINNRQESDAETEPQPGSQTESLAESHPESQPESQTRTALSNMEVGESYFLRGIFYYSFDYTRGLPKRGRDSDILIMRTLNETTSPESGIRRLSENPIWYIPVAETEQVDASYPGLEMLDSELQTLRFAQSNIYIRTTVDMSAMPLTQEQYASMELTAGRWIVKNDHEESHNVVVIHEGLASLRDIEIGDILTVSIPKRQIGIGRTGMGIIMSDIKMVGIDDNTATTHEMELEVVGIFRFISPTPGTTLYISTPLHNYMFIPESILPNDLDIDLFYNWTDIDYVDADMFLLDARYSFVLNDTRDINAFMLENEWQLSELGFSVMFFETGAENFWSSAYSVRNTAFLSLMVFSLLLLAVSLFILILHIHFRKKEYAIQRALGCSAKLANRQLLTAFVIPMLPTVAIGCISGWSFSLWRGGVAANPFGEFIPTSGISLDVSIPPTRCILLIVGVMIALSIMAMFLVRRLSRRSVLSLLRNAPRRIKA